MKRNVLYALALLVLTNCEFKRPESPVRAALEDSLVSSLGQWDVSVHPAGADCDVLSIESGLILDETMVESMHYGTSSWRIHGGSVYRFMREQGYRGVAYRDRTGKTWTYGAVTADEVKSLPRCEDVRPRNKRLALLIGIDDYTASRMGARPYEAGERDWPTLRGAVNDVVILEQMLHDDYDFDDVVTLTDQKATRTAILGALHALTKKSGHGDVVFFYFAGHGSQVANSRSAEPDRLDESIVPADSRAGARDIRDKELRTLFNRILDRGARLTVMLDNCHSASGARSLTVRGIAPDRHDVADPATGGAAPESRGALVLASVQDDAYAHEIAGDDGKMHGAFSWAWIRAMRDADADEAAIDTFLRAQARLRAERPFQTPVISGSEDARLTPFFGTRRGRDRGVVAVERVRGDGSVVLQGGLAHGLKPGNALQSGRTRLTITSMEGVTRSEAASEGKIRAGTLYELPRRTRHWHELVSESPSPFRLALRRESDGSVTSIGPVRGGERYSVVLRATAADLPSRFVYVFAIDSAGKSSLIYPKHGSVENRHTTGADLGEESAFRISPPYGIDTYFLLTTSEALPNPWMLGWEDARTVTLLNAGSWSLEKQTIESIP